MSAPPGHAPTLDRSTGIATVTASHEARAELCPDVAELIAAHQAQGRRLSPSRARMLVAQYLAAADKRADLAADPDRDVRILGIIPDPTPAEALKRIA